MSHHRVLFVHHSKVTHGGPLPDAEALKSTITRRVRGQSVAMACMIKRIAFWPSFHCLWLRRRVSQPDSDASWRLLGRDAAGLEGLLSGRNSICAGCVYNGDSASLYFVYLFRRYCHNYQCTPVMGPSNSIVALQRAKTWLKRRRANTFLGVAAEICGVSPRSPASG